MLKHTWNAPETCLDGSGWRSCCPVILVWSEPFVCAPQIVCLMPPEQIGLSHGNACCCFEFETPVILGFRKFETLHFGLAVHCLICTLSFKKRFGRRRQCITVCTVTDVHSWAQAEAFPNVLSFLSPVYVSKCFLREI